MKPDPNLPISAGRSETPPNRPPPEDNPEALIRIDGKGAHRLCGRLPFILFQILSYTPVVANQH